MKGRKIKILFFGLGSIGRRHARILSENFDCELYTFRSGENAPLKDFPAKEFTSLEDAFASKPDVAFITNPTYLHVETAIECAKRKIDLFMEKPVSHNMEGLDRLNELIIKNNIYSYVGFCLRFHPVIRALKSMLKKEQVLHSLSTNTTYLPDWRPHLDCRKHFSAHSEMGGGVLLEMMHELDYNCYLFGNVKEIKGRYGQASNLELECEDYADLLCEFENGLSSTIYLNMFSRLREREIRVYCPDKVIEGDFNKNTVKIFQENSCVYEENHENAIDVMYLEQMRYFIDNYQGKNLEIMNTVPEAAALLRILLDFKNKW